MACVTGEESHRYPSATEYSDTLEYFLCRACRFLSKQQMQDIIRKDQSQFSTHPNMLYEWYKKHLNEDYEYEYGHKHRPDESSAQNELKRMEGEMPIKREYPY